MSSPDPRTFFAQIWRKNRGYTLAEIESITGRRRSTVQKWVYDGLKHPQSKEIIKLRSMKSGGCRIVMGEWLIDFFSELARGEDGKEEG